MPPTDRVSLMAAGGVCEELHCRSERRPACRNFDKGAALAPAFSFAD
jgi:hypothetical protein